MFSLFSPRLDSYRLEGKRIYLRPPMMQDYKAWKNLRQSSTKFLQAWEPKWSLQEFDHDNFKHRIKIYHQQIKQDQAYPFFIFEKQSDILLGGINLTDIKRRSAQHANLGYWMGEPYHNKGFMSEAVNTIIDFAFESLKLHRVVAACIPHNKASKSVLENNHFIKEGFCQGYLKINGQWQDHLLFARINDKL